MCSWKQYAKCKANTLPQKHNEKMFTTFLYGNNVHWWVLYI